MLTTLENQNKTILAQQSHIDDLTSAVNDMNALIFEAEVSLATRASQRWGYDLSFWPHALLPARKRVLP